MKNFQKKIDVVSRYDQTANKYDVRYFPIQNLKFQLIFKRLQNFKTDMILDLGCGTGLLFSLLNKQTNLFIGVDISKKILEIALKKNKNKNLILICADIDFLPFRNEISSTIFLITVLQNLPDPLISIKEVNRVCKKDGITIFTILKKGLELEQFENMFTSTKLKKIFTWNMQETEDFATIRKKI